MTIATEVLKTNFYAQKQRFIQTRILHLHLVQRGGLNTKQKSYNAARVIDKECFQDLNRGLYLERCGGVKIFVLISEISSLI